MVDCSAHDNACLAVWSSGMILAQGARGPGFNSQNSPCLFLAPGAAFLHVVRSLRNPIKNDNRNDMLSTVTP